MNSVEKYIEEHWDESIRENRQDEDTLIGLPYPYTVPAVTHFNEMYYWDTYFTNKGLEKCGRWAQVKFNTDNMLYLVDKYGFMPNGSRTHYLNRSQPPFLSVMVRDVYEYYGDKVWLSGAYNALEKEYNFWMTKRITPTGLNRYGGYIAEDEIEGWASGWESRVGVKPEGTAVDIANHVILSAESGWDFNPRWGVEGYNYLPVDLNSLMYMLEDNMAFFSIELENGREHEWRVKADSRRKYMLEHMTDENGLMSDYNYKKDSLSPVFSAASFFPLFAGLADKTHAAALVAALDRLEAEYGILTCEKNDVPGSYQWDYPNGWACLQYIAIIGLDKYGYTDEAKRIAKKYIDIVEKVFDETGNLWEKYNVIEGNINVTNEYEMPPMMGWSAGIYLASKAFYEQK